MNTMIRLTLFAVILTVAVGVIAFGGDDSDAVIVDPAGTTAVDGICYTVDTSNNTVTVSGVTSANSSATAITIPRQAYITGRGNCTVLSIDDNVFQNMTSLQTVTFGSSSQCTVIGAHAFDGCTSLTSVSGATTAVTTIGEYAFYNCTSLQSAPFSVTSIGEGAFWNCSALVSSPMLRNMTSIPAHVFDGCASMGYPSINSGNSSLTVNIGDYAFRNVCSNSQDSNLALPVKLGYVGTCAFQGASLLIPSYNYSRMVLILGDVGESAFQDASFIGSSYSYVRVGMDGSSAVNVGDFAFSGIYKADEYDSCCLMIGLLGDVGESAFSVDSFNIRLDGSQYMQGDQTFPMASIAEGNIQSFTISGNNNYVGQYRWVLTNPDAESIEAVIQTVSIEPANVVIGENAFKNCEITYFVDNYGNLTIQDNAFNGVTGMSVILVNGPYMEQGDWAESALSVSDNAFTNATGTILNMDPVLDLSDGAYGTSGMTVTNGLESVSHVLELQEGGGGGSGGMTSALLMVIPVFIILGILMYMIQFMRAEKKEF